MGALFDFGLRYITASTISFQIGGSFVYLKHTAQGPGAGGRIAVDASERSLRLELMVGCTL